MGLLDPSAVIVLGLKPGLGARLSPRYPRWSALHSQRLLCVALCQGAALHFVNSKNGINDFDIWSFFCEIPGQPIRRRRVVSRDFGQPHFGTSPDKPDFIGRRVDLLLKSIPAQPGGDPILLLQNHLSARRTTTARCLSEKAAVDCCPLRLRGTRQLVLGL